MDRAKMAAGKSSTCMGENGQRKTTAAGKISPANP